MENIEETHFVVNMNNERILGFWGDTLGKYAEMVLGNDSMIMVVQISRKRQSMI